MLQTAQKLNEQIKKYYRLIKRKRNALQRGSVNPNYHATFNLDREVYISEVQDLIAKGLLFDFALRTNVIDPFVHFGMTKLGRNYMKYVSSE